MSDTVENLHADPVLTQAVQELVTEGYSGPGKTDLADRRNYIMLRETGSRLWLDTGDAEAAAKAWGPELEALTTNNTLVNQVVQTGVLDQFIRESSKRIRDVSPQIGDRDLVVELGFLANARLALGLVERFGAKVSVELHPDLGSDIDGILAFARRYFAICPDHFYIKVPLTPDGFIAVRRLSDEGIPVNYTLGFSARQNYLATRFSKPRFVNVFLGRLNQVVSDNGLGDPVNVGEKAAMASDEIVKGIRASSPDVATEQIAASIRNGKQVAALAGADVLTIPPKAAEEFLALGLSREDVIPVNWRDLNVQVSGDDLELLWRVDEPFVEFVEDALRHADDIASGAELADLSRKHEVRLFHSWTADDRLAIREKGKIPDVSRWGAAPLDDLMSVAALESFAVDQMALDDRIRNLAV